MKFLLSQDKISNDNILDAYLQSLTDRLLVPGFSDADDFIKLPSDQDLLDAIHGLARAKNPGGVKWIILVGIGGSSLGAEAVYQALNLVGASDLKNKLAFLTVADTVDPVDLSNLINQINTSTLEASELLLVVVGKSGQTTETAANAALIHQALSAKFGIEVIRDRVVVVSDDGSPLLALAEREGFSTISIPHQVGGRFSVFSAAGLFPLAVCGVNINEFVGGASLINDSAFEQAKQSALFLAEQYKQGKNIHDFFVFSKQLEGVGKWYRQLLAESVGKNGVGLAPVVLVGSTDLHSQAQLVFGGPKNRVTTLVSVERYDSDPIVPPVAGFSSLVNGLGGKSFGAVMEAIYQGTMGAYREVDLPVMEIKLVELSAKEVGALMQFLMIQVVCVCRLLTVDPYGQPAVENYKSKTRDILLK